MENPGCEGLQSPTKRKVWRHDSTGTGSMYPAAVSAHQAAPQRLDCPMLLEELSSLLAKVIKTNGFLLRIIC